jgi:hypothetical protein
MIARDSRGAAAAAICDLDDALVPPFRLRDLFLRQPIFRRRCVLAMVEMIETIWL